MAALIYESAGSHFVNKMSRLAEEAPLDGLRQSTKDAISRESKRRSGFNAGDAWKHAASLAIKRTQKKHFQSPLNIAVSEHMSGIDCYDGSAARTGDQSLKEQEGDEDLLVASPVADGRLKDEGRK